MPDWLGRETRKEEEERKNKEAWTEIYNDYHYGFSYIVCEVIEQVTGKSPVAKFNDLTDPGKVLWKLKDSSRPDVVVKLDMGYDCIPYLFVESNDKAECQAIVIALQERLKKNYPKVRVSQRYGSSSYSSYEENRGGPSPSPGQSGPWDR